VGIGVFAELKRQRMQIEMQIRSVIDAHSKLLEIGKESMDALDEADDKVAVFKQPPSTLS
jgi:cell division initiation protein